MLFGLSNETSMNIYHRNNVWRSLACLREAEKKILNGSAIKNKIICYFFILLSCHLE